MISLLFYRGCTRDLKISLGEPYATSLSLCGFSLYLKVQPILIPFLLWGIPHPLKRGKRDGKKKSYK